MRLLILTAFMVVSSCASAGCKTVWVDDDYNSMTPAVEKQICDSTLDLPAFNNPGVRPIQSPSIKPIESLSLPPLGTSRCRTERVYENYRWVDKKICS